MHGNDNEIITDIKRIRVNGDYKCDDEKLNGYQEIKVKFDIKSVDVLICNGIQET